MRLNRIVLIATLAVAAGSSLMQAQTQSAQAPEIQALKDELQRLEQSMQEVKAEISALETRSVLENEVASLKATAPLPSPPSPRVLPLSSGSLSSRVPSGGLEPTESRQVEKSQQQEPQAEDQKLSLSSGPERVRTRASLRGRQLGKLTGRYATQPLVDHPNPLAKRHPVSVSLVMGL